MRFLRAKVRDEDEELYFVTEHYYEQNPKAERGPTVVLLLNPYGLMVANPNIEFTFTVYPWDKVLWTEVEAE